MFSSLTRTSTHKLFTSSLLKQKPIIFHSRLAAATVLPSSISPRFPQNSKTPLVSTRSISFKKFKLIEQPAGYIVGTVNDAYVHPPADYFHGGYHWTYERAVGVAMVPLIILPFTAMEVEYPILDAILGSLLVVHCHAGLQSCIIDYIPKRRYGVWHTYAIRLLVLGSVVSFYGVYLCETEANGVYDFVERFWKSLS